MEPEMGTSADILDAEQVFVLMNNEHRIARNRRAEWFFAKLNTVVTLSQRYKLSEFTDELEIISIIPKNPPRGWGPKSSHLFKYRIGSRASINFLARKYRIVYCLDISSSVASVDVQAGLVMFEGIYDALKSSMEGLVRPFYVPGSMIEFRPEIHATVIAHTPFLASVSQQVLIQGIRLCPEKIKSILEIIFERLTNIESKVAEVTASICEAMENAQAKSDRIVGQIFDEEASSSSEAAIAMSPDYGFVDLMRQALIGFHLLPENSTAGLIVVTDGVISVPDGGYLDEVLSQLRYNTVSCSFIQLSSTFHPHLCYGILPYADLMRFISSATFGSFLTSVPEIKEDGSMEMNIYQKEFLCWSFQKALDGFKSPNNKPGEWSVRNKCFFSVRDMPIVKKQQYETTLAVDYIKILSCRLREGFTIKEVNIGQDNIVEIKLSLPWKFLIHIEYIMTTTLSAQAKVNCTVSLEGPYDFLHDVTCLAKKPFQSYYRQLMVTRFWASQKNLSESDKLLVHFNSFSTNPAFYNIPESLRNGVPLFYIQSTSSTPGLSTDFGSAQNQFATFAQFWKPVCFLDTTIWQKWMHTHSIGIILEHDHPLPKSLHMPNTSGRYHVIQCRQTVMALNTLLKDWSSFVLVENHSYIKLMLNDHESTPFSFYIIRITSKPPCVVLRLAFLVGTPGHLRHEIITTLRKKIAGLTFPQRLKEPSTEWRNLSPSSSAADETESSISKISFNKAWVLPCCTLLHKPIDKILIRYERVPRNLFKALLPQSSYNNIASPKAQGSQQSTFGFRPFSHTMWGSGIKMGPEIFNTVARYLHHRRWIWCVQSTSSSTLSLSCASQILSTLTKMRLLEGFRFANSAAGTVNMITELSMTENEAGKNTSSSSEIGKDKSDEDGKRNTSCVLQYVVFPPVTSLDSNFEDEEEGEGESVEGMGELYLVTECWIEPQCGWVAFKENGKSYMDGLEYMNIPEKIFEIDRECISALVTFEHLSLMCSDEKVQSPTHIPSIETKSSKPGLPSEDIKSIPFAFELNRILQKSQQAEILFSMFNQDLSMSYPVDSRNELSNFCDRANCVLYEAWSLNISKLHDREVFLASEEHETILETIRKRQKSADAYGIPTSAPDVCGESSSKSSSRECPPPVVPKWRCFIKGISPTHTHVILTILPASYHDLKLLMLSDVSMNLISSTIDDEDGQHQNVHLIPEHAEEDLRHPDDDVHTAGSEKNSNSTFDEFREGEEENLRTSTPIMKAKTTKDGVKIVSADLPPRASENLSTLAGRKRSRVKSGGESGPLAKKPLNRKHSVENSFRFRAASMDINWKGTNSARCRIKSADDKHYADHLLSCSSIYSEVYGESSCLSSSNKINESPTTPVSTTAVERKGFPENHQPKYGSITLPVFCYDCSLSQLIEHVIRRSSAGKNDMYLDFRVTKATGTSKLSKNSSEGTDVEENADGTDSDAPGGKSPRPETKTNESEFLPITVQVLRNHCDGLEVSWTKSYIHGLFESLQNDFFIHRNDIEVAMGMCQKFQVEIDLGDFIQTVCSHFKEAKQKDTSDSSKVGTGGTGTPSSSNACQRNPRMYSPSLCHEMTSVHSFIRKKFQNILLSTFNWVTDYSDIFYFKFSLDQTEMRHEGSMERSEGKNSMEGVRIHSKENIASAANSSKNTSEFDEVESLTVKAESACSDLLRVPSKEDMSRSPDYGSNDPLLSQEFIVQTMENGCDVEPDFSGPVPLFMYLTCSFNYKDNSDTFTVRDIPTCADEILSEVDEVISSEEIDLNELNVTMQFVFLTVPPEVDDIEKTMALQSRKRTQSMCSGSSLPTPKEEISPVITVEEHYDAPETEKITKKYPTLPVQQLLAVKKTVDDVKWLLRDEITSFRWDSDPLTEDVLDLISTHVQKSVGKHGCQLHIMPLTFVGNSYPLGFEKFKERFRNLAVDGFRLKEEGSWFYLVCTSKCSKVNMEDSENPKFLDSQNLQGESPCKDNITEEMLRDTLQKQVMENDDSDVEDAEIAQIAENNTKLGGSTKAPRKVSGQENISLLSKADSFENICHEVPLHGKLDVACDSQVTRRVLLATPSQMSEMSSALGSVVTNEEGYDGDGSESGGEDGVHNDLDAFRAKLPPFWMIFKLNAEQILVYFHCRYNEDDLSVFEYANKLLEKILRINLKLRRIVNQDLLLQELNDKRKCNPLLEPETDETDIWENREAPIPLPLGNNLTIPDENEMELVSQGTDSTMDFIPGTFRCDVVWKTKFYLHTRLRTGPGKSALSRGIQTLQTHLIAFEVTNRENMFVYRDSSGNVFYMRLSGMKEPTGSSSPTLLDNLRPDSLSEGKNKGDIDDTVSENRLSYPGKDTTYLDIHGNRSYSEDVVLLKVHGITEAGPEIKEQLVQSLRNKLDDSVLDILSVTLDRNPHCKLTPEDVHFIQKPCSQPDTVLKYEVNKYAMQYLGAFSYYLHQNLLQFLHVPKYTDFKAENHFQDYSRNGEEGSEFSDKNVYMYNQSPGGTGSRGIACIVITLIDKLGSTVKIPESSRPSGDAYHKTFAKDEFSLITATDEIPADGVNADVMLELRMWKQGRINVDLLKTFISTAIKHCMWDLFMEFYFLTAPLSANSLRLETVSASEPTTPMVDQNKRSSSTKAESVHSEETKTLLLKSSTVGLCSSSGSSAVRGGNFDSKEFIRSLERRNSANLPPLLPERADVETPRARSMSFSARKPAPTLDGRQLIGRAPSPLTLSQTHASVGSMSSRSKYHIDPTAVGLTRYETGEIGSLHALYSKWMKDWCDLGSGLQVPSLRIVPINLLCRHDVEITAQEVEKIIQSVAPDNIPRQYWKVRGSKNFTAGTLKSNAGEQIEALDRLDSDLKTFKNSLKRLKELEKLEETEYPVDLLELFKTPEDFNPASGGHECIIMSRNMIHWKMCVSNEMILDTLCIPEVPKNNYKFPPLMVGSMESSLFGGSPSSISLEKMSRVGSTNVLPSLSLETDVLNHPILIPRQRFLSASITNSQIVFVFYNWSKESCDRLVEHTKCLSLWLNARSSLLSSILEQKAGLFVNQPIQVSVPLPSLSPDGNPFTGGGVEVEQLLRNHAPPKEYSSGRVGSIKRTKSFKALAQFLECYRNVKHASLLEPPESNVNLLKAHGEQLLQNKMMDKKDSQNSLFQYWLLRGPSASNMINIDAIQSFKQAARTIHYCMTPILFLPRWRTEVAATRDSNIGTMKKSRASDSKKLQLMLRTDNSRSRHGSGASQRSLESNKTRNRSSIWGLWGNSSTNVNAETQASQSGIGSGVMNSRKMDEKWHSTLCESFIQEYVQYLQTLGFIPIHSKNYGPKTTPVKKESELERNRHLSGTSFTSLISSSSSQSGSSSYVLFGNYMRRTREESGDKVVHYLQKSLPGGILLFEIGLADPFFSAKLYALEATRIQKKKSRKVPAYQNTLSFLDECDKIKVLMHLHSFTFDFHLRSIHSYLSGRQLIFKQGYHLANFLDDFIKYYPKGPNFARNTVHIGMVTVQNVSTPSHILYNYILGHEKLYKMKVIRMTLQHPENSTEVVNEYILTQISSKKVTYKDKEDESQCDEFDLTLLIAHDTPPFVRPYSVDPSVLRLKYYIVLTSRRELYPKLVEEKRQGKLCIVNTPEALVRQKITTNSVNNPVPTPNQNATPFGRGSSRPNSRRPSLTDNPLTLNPNDNQPSLSLSSEKDREFPSDPRARKPSADKPVYEGIVEEQVNYMGYFSTHETMMQIIMDEQVEEVEKDIMAIVSKASVDCRRDLLWQRLLVGGQMDDKNRNKKEDLNSRETVGALTYWEFSEMLELVKVRSLSEMDPCLTSLLRQPITFYQNLLKLLTIKHETFHRYFVAPDNSTHQMTIFSPNVQQSVVMLDINLEKHTADLSIVFKELDDKLDVKVELEGDILNLVESVVNACCYCCWTTLV